jgi:uncharacterized SAM-binding protein YcdF (DUF218 family)
LFLVQGSGFKGLAVPNASCKRMKNRIIFFGILLAITTLYVGGCRRAGRWLVKEDVPAHADAMVLLMGGFPDRVLQAVDLYREGKAGRVIIVEESMGPFKKLEERGVSILSNSEQAANSLVTLGIPADSITILSGDAQSTLDEAIAVRDYLLLLSTSDTLLLVSSSEHMRRAAMIFMSAFRNTGKQVYVGCSPSTYTDFNADRWWRDKEGIQAVLTEYVKIGSFILVERKKFEVN